MITTTKDGRPIFSHGAVIAWARSMGISDSVALSFMMRAGALVVEDSQTAKG